MPSPFPGMDPSIESQKRADFHTASIAMIRELLAQLVADRYTVNIEERIYIDDPTGDDLILIPDVQVSDTSAKTLLRPTCGSTSTAIAPVECLLPDSESSRQRYLEIRTTYGGRLITVIELLSPTNKQAESQGRRKYICKHKALLETEVNLVEIDLLRCGRRLPMKTSLPPGDYYALISRGHRCPRSSVYAWKRSERMPSIPIPLSPDDPEPELDLQTVLDLVYDRGFYRLSLKYNGPVFPPLTDVEERSLRSLGETRPQSSIPSNA